MIQFFQKLLRKKEDKKIISFKNASGITAGYPKGAHCEGDIRPMYNR